MAKKKKSGKPIQVTLVKSPIGYSERQKNTLKALGLRRLKQTVTHEDSPAIRGMLDRVGHLVQISEE